MGTDSETSRNMLRAQLARGPRADRNRLEALLEVLQQLEAERRRRVAEEEAERARVRGNVLDLLGELEEEQHGHQDTKRALRACREEKQHLMNASHAALDQLHKEIDELLKSEEDKMGNLQMEIGQREQELETCQKEKQDLIDAIDDAKAEHVQAMNALRNQLRQFEATNQSLLNDVAAARERTSKLDKERAGAAKHRQLVKEMEEKLQTCTEAKAELKRSLKEARLDTAQAQAEGSRIHSEMVREQEALQEANGVLLQQLAEQTTLNLSLGEERGHFVAAQQAERTTHAQELAARATELRLEREAHMQAIEHIRKEASEQEQRHAAALEAVSLQHADALRMQAQIQNLEQFLEQVLNDMEKMVQHMNKLRKDNRGLKRKAQVQAERHSATLQETRAVDRRQIAALKEELIHSYAQSDELIDKRRKLDDLRQQLHQANLDRQNKQHRQATERLVAKHQAQIDRMVEQIQNQEEEVAEHQAQIDRMTERFERQEKDNRAALARQKATHRPDIAKLRTQFKRREEEHHAARIAQDEHYTREQRRQSRIIADLQRTIERLERQLRSVTSRATRSTTTATSSSAAIPGPAAQRRRPHRPSSAASSVIPTTTPAASITPITGSARASLEDEWALEIGQFPAGIQLWRFDPALVVRAMIASRHVAREQGLVSITPAIFWNDASRLTLAIRGMQQDGTLPRGGGGDISSDTLMRRISHHHLTQPPSVIHAFVMSLLLYK
jgi:chromosome segregation ATPase